MYQKPMVTKQRYILFLHMRIGFSMYQFWRESDKTFVPYIFTSWHTIKQKNTKTRASVSEGGRATEEVNQSETR